MRARPPRLLPSPAPGGASIANDWNTCTSLWPATVRILGTYVSSARESQLSVNTRISQRGRTWSSIYSNAERKPSQLYAPTDTVQESGS